MRISDWSSDVCSSDLHPPRGLPEAPLQWRLHPQAAFRFRSGCLVLAFRRCRLVVPVPLHLCLGFGLRGRCGRGPLTPCVRSEEHTSELQSLMRFSYVVFCLTKKTQKYQHLTCNTKSE